MSTCYFPLIIYFLNKHYVDVREELDCQTCIFIYLFIYLFFGHTTRHVRY